MQIARAPGENGRMDGRAADRLHSVDEEMAGSTKKGE
jgi:hypothetical protein